MLTCFMLSKNFVEQNQNNPEQISQSVDILFIISLAFEIFWNTVLAISASLFRPFAPPTSQAFHHFALSLISNEWKMYACVRQNCHSATSVPKQSGSLERVQTAGRDVWLLMATFNLTSVFPSREDHKRKTVINYKAMQQPSWGRWEPETGQDISSSVWEPAWRVFVWAKCLFVFINVCVCVCVCVCVWDRKRTRLNSRHSH